MDIFGWITRKFEDATVLGMGKGLARCGLLEPHEADNPDAIRAAIADRLTGPLTFPPIGEGPGETKPPADAGTNGHAGTGKPRSRIGGKAK